MKFIHQKQLTYMAKLNFLKSTKKLKYPSTTHTHMKTLCGQKNHLTIHSHISQSSFHDQAAPSPEAGISHNAQSKKYFVDTERHLHQAFTPTMAHAPVKVTRHLRHFAIQTYIPCEVDTEVVRGLEFCKPFPECSTHEAWLPYRRPPLQSWRWQAFQRPEYHVSTTSEIAFSFNLTYTVPGISTCIYVPLQDVQTPKEEVRPVSWRAHVSSSLFQVTLELEPSHWHLNMCTSIHRLSRKCSLRQRW